ncbi:hypothetical protein SAMD00019534_105070 [Acytostelium subglobosum LB1]|uniref:hypothetical protein n=1 Tax=Acytostelium subglobosum LB1 TaxID=1410327 RepID=UPI0006449923|nr:hypothetical protein SAMD00019534_105070 [Acytostelium subglobosum LB1]GAM27332.1 hypothetical protein SAMD00019534_105070 [Acytostelium subglobosum LB1]|eukprot:XP_012749799.1 hypothetical protein SAMD00019534_105070 [Acytostelium subglobosum LB1]
MAIRFKNNDTLKFTTADTDNILKSLHYSFVNTFPALTIGKALIFTILPESRILPIFQANINKDSTGPSPPCGSFAITYKSVCDFMGIAPLLSVIWDIENLYPCNNVKEFNLNEVYQCTPYDVRALIMSLAYNNYFTSLVSSNFKLSTEEMNQLTETVRVSSALQKLHLNNIQSSKESIMAMLAGLSENKTIKLQHINLSNNILESKGIVALGTTIQALPSGLTYINVENTSSAGKPMEAFFHSLLASPSVSTLNFLSINNNKLELAGSGALCRFLSKATALHTLQMSNTGPVYKELKSGNNSLKVLDFSGNKPSSSKETIVDLFSFLKQLPALTSINLARLYFSEHDLKQLFGPATSLIKAANVDLSDNDLGDSGIIRLCEVMYPNTNLRHLAIDNNFKTSRSKLRVRAVEALCNLIEDNVTIESLSIACTSGTRGLKNDLVPFVLLLLKNESLVKLDISGNGIGDSGAMALAKILWKNQTLKQIKIDGNDFSMDALKIIKQSMKRNNKSVTLLNMPLLDINAILLGDKSTTGQDKTHKALIEIQNLINSNVAHQFKYVPPPPERTGASSPAPPVPMRQSGSTLHVRTGSNSSSFIKPAAASPKPPATIDITKKVATGVRGPLYPGRQLQQSDSFVPQRGGTINGSIEMPPIVAKSITQLLAKGTKVLGIFRTCASANMLKQIKARFEAGEDVDLEGVEPDTVAGVLKGYFRELPVPLFAENIHDRFFLASRQTALDEKIAGYRDIVELLTPLEAKMVRKLFYLLHLIALEKDENMMSAENLSICWAPTLFRSFSSDLLPINAFLIQHYFDIFDPENAPAAKPRLSVTLATSTTNEGVAASQLSPNSINGNNSQVFSSGGTPSSTSPPGSPSMDGNMTLRGKRFSRMNRLSYSPSVPRARGNSSSNSPASEGWSESSRTVSSLFQDEWEIPVPVNISE